jgi:DNA modification methylase
MAFLANRKYLGVDISAEYINIARTRILKAQKEQAEKLFYCFEKKPAYGVSEDQG